MTGEREAADLKRARAYLAAAQKCRQCDGMGIVVVDYGSPSQPVHELICDSCNGTGRG